MMSLAPNLATIRIIGTEIAVTDIDITTTLATLGRENGFIP